MGVGDYRAVRADLDGGGLLVDVDGDAVACDVGLNGEVGEKLYGKDPGFKSAVLLADEDTALACDREGLEGLGVGADDRAGGVESN
jgi:hypothetical protein